MKQRQFYIVVVGRVARLRDLTRRSTGRAGTQLLVREHRRGPPVS
jgi:hypothetical protein